MAEFSVAFARTMRHEGGYVNDPDDPGGETYRGISRGFNPGWAGWRLIDKAKKAKGFPRNLSRNGILQEEVVHFYKAHHWDKFCGDTVPLQNIANELFDTGVNVGVTRAVEFLQRALNALNRNGKLYRDLVVDGILGQKTLRALKIYLKKDKPGDLLKIMNILQGMFYIDRMGVSPTQEKFARGWFKRVDLSVA